MLAFLIAMLTRGSLAVQPLAVKSLRLNRAERKTAAYETFRKAWD